MKSKIENCLYMQVAHCNKCGGQSGYNIIDGEKVCFDCGEPYEADFSVSKVETTITTTNSQDQGENEPEKVYVDPIVPDFIAEKLAEERYNTREILLNGTKPLEVEDTPEEKEEWEKEFELPDEIEHEDCIEVLADKHKLWEICSWEEPELDPDKVVAFIKQLLEERECRAREEGRREVIHKLKEEIDMAEVSKFIDAHQDFFNSFGESVLLKISELTTK